MREKKNINMISVSSYETISNKYCVLGYHFSILHYLVELSLALTAVYLFNILTAVIVKLDCSKSCVCHGYFEYNLAHLNVNKLIFDFQNCKVVVSYNRMQTFKNSGIKFELQAEYKDLDEKKWIGVGQWFLNF